MLQNNRAGVVPVACWDEVVVSSWSDEMAAAGDVLKNSVTGHRYHILRSGSDTGGQLLEMIADFPPGVPEPPDHYHPHQEEHFEILEGVLHLRCDGTQRELRAGDTLVVPAGTRHAMWTTPTTSASVRWQTRPALRSGEFFETTVRLARDGRIRRNGTPDLLDSALLLRTFRNEFRIAKPSAIVQSVVFGIASVIARLAGRRLPST